MDLQIRDDSPDIHSFPPPWKVPRKRKSRSTPRGGRDCYDTTDENSDLHSFPPPWKVPRKRKSRGPPRGGRDCYDPTEGNIYFIRGENIDTHNRYSLLRDGDEEVKEILHSSKRKPDSSPARKRKRLRTFYFEDFGDFCRKNSEVILSHLFDNSKSIVYSNKYNMCSGYFPDFILSPYLDNCSSDGYFKNDNDVFINGSPNFIDNTDDYYPHFRDGKFSKQISNANSKYNNSYFLKMKPIYKICKKVLGTIS